MTPHELYGSLDALLSTEALGRIEGRSVAHVRRRPFTTPYAGVSGNPFLSVETTGHDGTARSYIVKRTAPAWDIIMRVTGDTACREMLVWQRGLLDRLPPEVGHTVVAGAVDGDGWALLLRDIGNLMHPCQRWPSDGWAPLNQHELLVFLDGLAALHERYWEDAALLEPALGLCELPALYASFSPAVAAREAGSPHALITVLSEGWRQFERVAASELVRLVQALQADTRPLHDALRRFPWTLVHADPSCKNFGITLAPDPQIILFDWQLVTRAPPAVDLAFFLSLFSAVLPVSYDEAIDQYRDRLAARLGRHFDDRWWQPQLDVALLGQFLRFGALLCWRMTHHDDIAVREHYRTVLDWWTPRALAGAARL